MGRSKKRTPAQDAALRELVALLAPNHAATKRAVDLAIDDPDAYARKFRQRIEDRFAEDLPVDPWLALVSALAQDGVELACSVDWKSAADDVAGNLRRVVAAHRYDVKQVFAFYDEDRHLATATPAFLALCGRALSAHGLALIELELDSDSYELAVVPWGDAASARRLARRAGASIALHAPKTPLARPLPQPPPKPRSRAKLEKFVLGRGLAGTDWGVDADGFEQTPGFLLRIDAEVAIVDCRVWPPTLSRRTPTYASTAIDDRTGAQITYDNRSEGPRRLTIERPGRRAIDLASQRPAGFDIERAIWLGERVVLLPRDWSARAARRPLVWNGKRLAPVTSLPAANPTRALVRGYARTGDGIDVLIWAGWGWVAKGDRFVKQWKLLRELDPSRPLVGAPAPGDGFFFHHRLSGPRAEVATLREARDGGCRERVRFRRVVDGPPRTAMDGRVIFGLNRYGDAKAPVLGVFHPETDELTWVPPHVLGFRKDDQVDAYGVVAPARGEPYLWVLDDTTVRRIAWRAILALPRLSE